MSLKSPRGQWVKTTSLEVDFSNVFSIFLISRLKKMHNFLRRPNKKFWLCRALALLHYHEMNKILPNCLISTMGLPMLARWHLYIEMKPSAVVATFLHSAIDVMNMALRYLFLLGRSPYYQWLPCSYVFTTLIWFMLWSPHTVTSLHMLAIR